MDLSSKFLLAVAHMYISGMVTRFVISLINFRNISYVKNMFKHHNIYTYTLMDSYIK